MRIRSRDIHSLIRANRRIDVNIATGNEKQNVRTYEENRLIEEAIKFLVASIEKSGKNPKPVILHSIRVAMYLENLGYTKR